MREKKAVSAETFICIGAIILVYAFRLGDGYGGAH